ncbi:hypothetical protein LCGC14_1184550 [marine sediment metagenome]|uniref:Uncharacterized protein n=1 Tax=marine sediment metagenome TaxID=412755 RepID=A0A0F9LLA3_9ZZZZ
MHGGPEILTTVIKPRSTLAWLRVNSEFVPRNASATEPNTLCKNTATIQLTKRQKVERNHPTAAASVHRHSTWYYNA